MPPTEATVDVEQLLQRAADAAANPTATSADLRELLAQIGREIESCGARCQGLHDEEPRAIVRSPKDAAAHQRHVDEESRLGRRLAGARTLLTEQLERAATREEAARLDGFERQAKDIIGRWRALEARRRELYRELVGINVQVRALAEEYSAPHGALHHTGRLHRLGDDFLHGPRLPENPRFVPADPNELPPV